MSSFSCIPQELIPGIWEKLQYTDTARAFRATCRNLRDASTPLIRRMELRLCDLTFSGPGLSTSDWAAGWPADSVMRHMHVISGRNQNRLLRFPYLVLTKGSLDLCHITKVVLDSSVAFDSTDLDCMAKACPALADLTLGDTDERYVIGESNHMRIANSDVRVLEQLHSMKALRKLSVALDAMALEGTELAAILNDLVDLPPWVTDIGISADNMMVTEVRELTGRIPDAVSRITSLSFTSAERDGFVDIDVFAGLTALTQVLWDPCEEMDGLVDELPRLPMRCVRSLLLCERLTDLHMAFEVDADVAEALLRLPLLANLTVQGPMPLPPNFDDIAVSAGRRAPLKSIRFGEKLSTDWTPLLHLVNISRRI